MPDFFPLREKSVTVRTWMLQDSMALLMITRDRKKHVLKMPVNDDGKFEQNGLFFYDSVQVVYRFNHAAKLSKQRTDQCVFRSASGPDTCKSR